MPLLHSLLYEKHDFKMYSIWLLWVCCSSWVFFSEICFWPIPRCLVNLNYIYVELHLYMGCLVIIYSFEFVWCRVDQYLIRAQGLRTCGTLMMRGLHFVGHLGKSMYYLWDEFFFVYPIAHNLDILKNFFLHNMYNFAWTLQYLVTCDRPMNKTAGMHSRDDDLDLAEFSQ